MENTRKKDRIEEERDLISLLPLNVIECILECLPFQYAVRTSALARKWRYIWTSMSKLTFDTEFYEYLAERELGTEFAKIVSNTLLLLRENPIVSFSVHALGSSSIRMGDIDNWILFLLSKGIKQFTLNIFYYLRLEECYMPRSFFAYQNLTHLDLLRCVFTPPSTFRGFPNLVVLKLGLVSLEEKCFHGFVVNSPLLEKMILRNLIGVTRFDISAPRLKHLVVEGEFVSISINAENLRMLSLIETQRIQTTEGKNIISELGKLLKLEKLYLGARIFKFIDPRGTPKMLPTSLNCLKSVTFHLIDLQDPIQISFVVCIMRSAPNLKQLEIRAILLNNAVVGPVSRLSLDDCILKNLEVVYLPSIRGSRTEMELIECLLASSPNLKLMFVGVDGNLNQKMESKISRELLLFCRASPRAVIRVSNPYEELESQ